MQPSSRRLCPCAAAAKSLQSCPTLCDPRQQPTRLPRPWDSPGKNPGVGCHFLLQYNPVKSESEVAQSCLTLSDPVDCSLPDSSIHRIFVQLLGIEAFLFPHFLFVGNRLQPPPPSLSPKGQIRTVANQGREGIQRQHWGSQETIVQPWGRVLVLPQFSSVAPLCPTLATTWTAAWQASLSVTNSRSLLKLMAIESLMPSNHLILCHSLLLLPSIFPSIRVFSNESVLRIRWPKYWSFSFSISPSSESSGLICFRMDWFDLLAIQGTLKNLLQHHRSKASILWPQLSL